MPADRYGRSHRRYREAVARLRARRIPLCALCHRPIDYSSRRGPDSFSLDHVRPVSLGGSLLDPANHQPAHLSCNVSRGNRPPQRPVITTRRW